MKNFEKIYFKKVRISDDNKINYIAVTFKSIFKILSI